MKLKTLIGNDKDIVIRGKKDVEILGLSSDSRTLAPGDLFFALKGDKYDGSNFLEQAILHGAKAVVTDLYDPFLDIPQIITPFPRKWMAPFASRFYKNPSENLFCVGITGSKGKTTTTYLCKHLLDKIGMSSGLISTIDTWIGDLRQDSSCTTKDVISNQKLLHEMVQRNCKSACIEVSSHGLMQARVEGIDFDVAVFTNLHPDHLDYHKTIQQYAEAKRILFDLAQDSIINLDSPWSSFMKSKRRCITYGIENSADLTAKNIQSNEKGLSFTVDGVLFRVPLFGIYNVSNTLAALSLGVYQGKTLKELQDVFEDFQSVPGRFEKVLNTKNIHVVVDYAHTGESLASVLQMIRQMSKGKIFVVFGCGGERDPFRRQTMAKAAEKYADYSIITADNPRSESLEGICGEIKTGFQSLQNVEIILDRKEAIEQALSLANEGDFVLIAGKGHEKTQVFSGRTIRFDDVLVAQEFLQR